MDLCERGGCHVGLGGGRGEKTTVALYMCLCDQTDYLFDPSNSPSDQDMSGEGLTCGASRGEGTTPHKLHGTSVTCFVRFVRHVQSECCQNWQVKGG